MRWNNPNEHSSAGLGLSAAEPKPPQPLSWLGAGGHPRTTAQDPKSVLTYIPESLSVSEATTWQRGQVMKSIL